jgi:AmmeMemoRadiSam system protein B
MVRKPVVSGKFYPASAQELKKLLKGFVPEETKKMLARAVILPHAGYIYSGKVAAVTVNKILKQKRVIILGPKHTDEGLDYALWPKGAWDTPLGEVKIDEELAEKILAKGNYIKADYLAHGLEHSIEVELPFLLHFFGEFKFIPIACQVAEVSVYQQVATQIYEGIKLLKDEILLVASTDMTHYEPDATARKKDRAALEYIVNLDEEGLLNKVLKENITMCGVAPVAILISLVKQLGVKKTQVALYETSANASGDYNSVVGYAGVIIS